MKAAQISEYGDASVVSVVEVDKPEVAAGKVLVEVHASSLNPFDTMVRAGYVKEMFPVQLPFTLGGDIAGTVIAVGDGVSHVAVGDNVFGQAAAVAGNSGAFAEFATTDAGQVAKAPRNLNMNETASLPLVGASAVQSLMQHIKLEAGQKILITGGAGGIGQVAIQIAKHLGAYVATTATGDGVALATAHGADEVIDYTSQDFTKILSEYDAVFDTVGGDQFNTTITVVKKGGVVVTMSGQPDEAKAAELGVKVIAQMTQVVTPTLDTLRELIEAGVVKPHVGKVFPLDDIQAAFQARESSTVVGKIVIEIKN